MRTAARRGLLVLPWAVLSLILFLIGLDNYRSGTTHYVDYDQMQETLVRPSPDRGPTAIDPLCGMEVRKKTAHKAVHQESGKTRYFCSTFCRAEFLQDPAAYPEESAPPQSHTMLGIPTWMYQTSIALILALSFLLFEIFARLGSSETPRAMDARVELTALPGIRALLKWPPLVSLLRMVTATAFLLVIAAGLFGDQNAGNNVVPLLTWTVWWAGLVFVILYLGKAWCTICPWDAIATWLERLKFRGPRGEGLGLGLQWPPAFRNIWLAVALFLLLTWIEEALGVTFLPRVTAWIALGMLGLAIVSVFLFDRKAFCRYGCLVGRISGLYALFSPIEVRAKDHTVCASCKTMDCIKGSGKGDGCPTFEFPRTMTLNTYCTLCTECFKTCPHDNMALNLRPWGADLAHKGKPRTDEAFLALVLLSMTAFHGLTMTPSWQKAVDATGAALGASEWTAFTLLMTAMLLTPIAIYSALIGISRIWSGDVDYKTLFINYSYAMLPIALFYHLAHNAEHFLQEGPKILPMLSDPFGWDWNLFGTADWKSAPMITLEGLWWIQILFVLIGHIYGLWISDKTTRRLIPAGRPALLSQLPMLAAMVAFSVFSLWLLKQPMEMRLSAM